MKIAIANRALTKKEQFELGKKLFKVDDSLNVLQNKDFVEAWNKRA